jgi:hypothetical protein
MKMHLPSFHDWFLTSISVDVNALTATVTLQSDNKHDVVQLLFEGAPRLLFEGFSAQNIVSDLRIIDVDSAEYPAAVAQLEEAHPWGNAWPKRKIARFSASLGVEGYIEFDRVTLAQKPM